jgi:hypothetical protein
MPIDNASLLAQGFFVPPYYTSYVSADSPAWVAGPLFQALQNEIPEDFRYYDIAFNRFGNAIKYHTDDPRDSENPNVLTIDDLVRINRNGGPKYEDLGSSNMNGYLPPKDKGGPFEGAKDVGKRVGEAVSGGVSDTARFITTTYFLAALGIILLAIAAYSIVGNNSINLIKGALDNA